MGARSRRFKSCHPDHAGLSSNSKITDSKPVDVGAVPTRPAIYFTKKPPLCYNKFMYNMVEASEYDMLYKTLKQIESLIEKCFGAEDISEYFELLEIAKQRKQKLFVCWENDNIIAMVVANKSNIGENLIEGTWGCVHPDFRNKGIGKLMIEKLIDYAILQDSSLVFGTAIPQYFEKLNLGFIKIAYHNDKWLIIKTHLI